MTTWQNCLEELLRRIVGRNVWEDCSSGLLGGTAQKDHSGGLLRRSALVESLELTLGWTALKDC